MKPSSGLSPGASAPGHFPKIMEMMMDQIPCPFVYANGKRCAGHITKVEAYKADLSWDLQADGTWKFEWGPPRSHYHVFCSAKGNHAGYERQDDPRMKFYVDKLPDGLWEAMNRN
jgi:hypothetical protein